MLQIMAASTRESFMKKPRTSKITTFGLGIVAMLALSVSAATAANVDPLDFSGYYAPANWTTTNTNADGSVNSASAPASITITGGNNGSGLAGTTDFTRAAQTTGIVSFNWSYTTTDGGDPSFPNGSDPAGYLLNGVFFQLTVGQTSPQSGTNVTFNVTAGQIFGFRVRTEDNGFGPGVFTISNFSQAVPEPSTFLLLAPGIGIFWLLRRRRNLSRAMSSAAILVALMLSSGSIFAQSNKYIGQPAGAVSGPRIIDVTELAKTPAPAGTVSSGTELDTRHHEPLPPPSFRTGAGAQRGIQPKTTPLAPLVNVPFAPINFRGWTGLTHLDQRNANSGNQFSIEPPDQALAVGASRVFESINEGINVYNLNGVQQIARPLAINEFFGVAPAINRTTNVRGPSIGDPVAFYDKTSNRFFFACYGQTLTGNVPQQQSQIYLAVSQTSDPAGLWYIYIIDTTNASDPDGNGPRFPDYPHIACDANGVYISVNEFDILPSGNLDGYDDAAIYCLSKSALIAGGGLPPVTRIVIPYTLEPVTGAGFAFTVYPAVVPPGGSFFAGSGGVQFFVSSDSNNDTGTGIAIWGLSNTSSLNTASPALTLTKVVVNTLPYDYAFDLAAPGNVGCVQKEGFRPLGLSLTNPGNPDSYPNPPATLPRIAAGDDRIQNASYAAGRIWCALGAQITGATPSQSRMAADYFCFAPGFRGGTLSATLLTQGTIDAGGSTHLLRPAVVCNASNKGGLVFTQVGLSDYPSSAFVPIDDLNVGTITLSSAGKVPQDGFTGYPAVGGGIGITRWGDYSAAMVNTDGSIYMATEYCPDINRTINANWCTYVTQYFPN